MKMKIPNIIIPWHKSINLVNWKSNQRYETQCISLNLVEPLNISIIITCCTIIEGFLITTLKDHIFILDTKTNPEVEFNGITMIPLESRQYELIKRILDDYTVLLQQGKFENYLKVFKILVDIDIPLIIPTQLFEATKKMFQLRNQFVHGAEIAFETIENNNTGTKCQSPSGKFKDIVEFLSKPNIGINLVENDKVNLLKNEVANFFHDITIKFITTLNDSLHQSQRTILPEKLNQILIGEIEYRD
jgi:hypothetical protein